MTAFSFPLFALIQGVAAIIPSTLWGGRVGAPTGAAAASAALGFAKSVDEINSLWASRGLFIHQFDALQDYARPWLVNTSASSFTSVAMVSARFPYLYSTYLGGMLFASNFVLNATEPPVRCACACDCDSMGRGPTGCSEVTEQSGSLPADTNCAASKETLATAYRTVDDMLVRLEPRPNSRCLWTPTEPYPGADVDEQGRVRPPPGETPLSHFECMYNEIVLDAYAVNSAMPETLDAFFFPQNCWQDPRSHLNPLPGNATAVQAVYEQFTAAFPTAHPLFLSFDCAKLARHEPPFADASASFWTASAGVATA